MSGYNFKKLLIVFQIVWPIIPSVGALIGVYRGYLKENVYQTQKIITIQNEIDTMKPEIKALMSKNYDFKLELKGMNDRIQNNSNRLIITDTYQQTLRKEVQRLAEGKLNISEFWHYVSLFFNLKKVKNND